MFKNTIIYIAIILACVMSPKLCTATPIVRAESAAIGDVKSGQLIYEKNAKEKRPPASLTKIMTAIIAVEFGDIGQNVTVSAKAARIPPSKLYIHKGEVIQLNSLLKSALMISANDACVAIAEHVGGDEAYFVNLMNLKAWALGMGNTNFVNTNGLPAKEHYSCAYDLVRLGIYSRQVPYVNEYTAQKSDTITRSGGREILNNTNKLLWSYPGANGIKTGTTNLAGQCLAASANVGERAFVAVVLRAGDRYVDSRVLLNYAFANYTPQKIFTKDRVETVSLGRKNILIPVTTLQDYYFPLSDGETVKTYIIPFNTDNKLPRKGEKCGLLAIVTVDGVLWYDIFAKEDSPQETIYDRMQYFVEDILLLFTNNT